jgi:hypothetical protein
VCFRDKCKIHIKVWLENLKVGDHLEDRAIDERIILEWILKKQEWNMLIGFIWFRTSPVAFSCEHGNETWGSIKGEVFLDELSDC